MIKVAVIGDIHGRKDWKVFKDVINEYDKIVFMGDYVDSLHKSDSQILSNLNEILLFKESNPDKVILITGNHDNQYYFKDYRRVRASGFRQTMFIQLKNIFTLHQKSFCTAYQFKNTLFTHGGLMTGFYNQLLTSVEREENENYADYLNKIWKYKESLLLDVSAFRGGTDKYSGPFWTDWVELTNQKQYLPINQVVGHSARYGGLSKKINNGDNFLLDVDILDKEDSYFEILFDQKENFLKKEITYKH